MRFDPVTDQPNFNGRARPGILAHPIPGPLPSPFHWSIPYRYSENGYMACRLAVLLEDICDLTLIIFKLG